MNMDKKLNEKELENVVGGLDIPDDYQINYVSYKSARRFIPGLCQQEGVEAAIQFGLDRIVNSNIWYEMRDIGPEATVDKVYGFYYSYCLM